MCFSRNFLRNPCEEWHQRVLNQLAHIMLHQVTRRKIQYNTVHCNELGCGRLEEFIDDQRHGMALQLEPQGLLFAEVRTDSLWTT